MKKLVLSTAYVLGFAAANLMATTPNQNLVDQFDEDEKNLLKVAESSVEEVPMSEDDWQTLLDYGQDTTVSAREQDDEDYYGDDDEKKGIDLSTIENIGKLTGDFVRFIEERAPVVSAETFTANALPSGAESVDELSNLSDLNVKKYEYKATNVVGIPLYTTQFLVVHRHGGTYDGEGQFLANITIVPVSAWAPFLYNVSVEAGNVQVANIGTAEEPNASLTLEVRIHGKGLISTTLQKIFYEFRGDSAEHKMYH